MKKENFIKLQNKALEYIDNAGIILTDEERKNVEVTDFGLNEPEIFGLLLIVYENNDKYCAKELVLLPWQICAEHRHPNIDEKPGKQETFRCRKGKVFLYVEGIDTKNIKGRVPPEKSECFTVKHEIELNPGEQYTIAPNTKHWFQAAENGAIVSEFSTSSRDEYDIFTDPQIKRFVNIDF